MRRSASATAWPRTAPRRPCAKAPFSGVLKECDEGELKLVEKEKIYSLPIWEGDKIFLRLIEENGPFFSLKLEYAGDKLIKATLNGKVI